MKKFIVLVTLICVVCLAAGCRKSASESVYHKISPEEARRMMQETNNYILLDVRTEREFQKSHIEGAVLIPAHKLKDRAAIELPDKNSIILVYCRSGNRSKTAADILVGMGYTQVYDFGGIINWPFETVSTGG